MLVGNVKPNNADVENDIRTPISQTEEYYQALKMNKVPTVTVRFNKEYHGKAVNPLIFKNTWIYQCF